MFLRDSMHAVAEQLRTVVRLTADIAHQPTKGALRESRARALLAERLPHPFRAFTGIAVNVSGDQSLQQDFLIADQSVAAPFVREGELGILPAESIAGCIEVKSVVDRAEIRDGIAKISSVKRLLPVLKRTRMEDIGDGTMAPRWNENKAFGALFGLSSERNLATIQRAFLDESMATAAVDRPNAVFVLDKGAIFWSQEAGLSIEMAPQAAKYSTMVAAPEPEDVLMLFNCYLIEFLRVYVPRPMPIFDYLRATGVPLDFSTTPLS